MWEIVTGMNDISPLNKHEDYSEVDHWVNLGFPWIDHAVNSGFSVIDHGLILGLKRGINLGYTLG